MYPHAYQELCLSEEMPPGSPVVFGKEAMKKTAIDEQCVLKVVKSLWIIFIFNWVIFSSWYWHLYLQSKACCNPLNVSHPRIQFYNSLRVSMMFEKHQKNQLLESGKFTQSAVESQSQQRGCLFLQLSSVGEYHFTSQYSKHHYLRISLQLTDFKL